MILKKERIVVVTVSGIKEEAKPLWNEAKELNLIFNSIYRKIK